MKYLIHYCFMFFTLLNYTSFLIAQVDLNKGLSAYYSFNGNAQDSSVNNFHAIENQVILTNDRNGEEESAYHFNGTTESYIRIPNNSGFIRPDTMTYVLWIKPDGLNFDGFLISQGSGTNSWNVYFGSWNYSLDFNLDGGSWGGQPFTVLFSEGWHCLIFTHSVTGDGEVFIDGVKKEYWNYINWSLPETDAEIIIGNKINILNYGWQGDIDEIRIYNRFLTQDEISLLSYYDPPVGIDETPELILDNYKLSQNYPNPFNPNIIIKYTIPLDEKRETKNVKLVVYDVQGEEKATLVNKKQKPGNYQVEFDGNNLSSGVYFYRLQTDGFIETKKMLLLK